MSSFIPSFGFVLIEPITETKTTKSGLTLPDSAPKGNILRGKVLATGYGNPTQTGQVIAMDFKIDEMVLFRKYNAEEIELDGLKYVVDQKDILGTIKV